MQDARAPHHIPTPPERSEAAVAAVSKVEGSKVQLSVQDHYFCSGTGSGVAQQCDSGSSMPGAHVHHV